MNPFQRFVNYLRASKIELEKVAWPSKQEVIRYSGLVIIASFAATVFFGTLDTVLHGAITAVIARRTPTTQAPATTPDIEVTPVDVTTSSSAPVTVTPVPSENVITGEPSTPNVIKP